MAAAQEDDDLRALAERSGIAAYLKDALAVLLEVRPEDPLPFLSAYFKHASQPDDLAALAWYLIRACPRSRPCFPDNLFSAFCALSRGHADAVPAAGNAACPSRCAEAGARVERGMPLERLEALLREVCSPLPPEVSRGLLAEVGRTLGGAPGGLVGFQEFSLAVETCLDAVCALERLTRALEALDQSDRGTVRLGDLVAVAEASEAGESRDAVPALAELLPPAAVLREQLAGLGATEEVAAGELLVLAWRDQQGARAGPGGEEGHPGAPEREHAS